MSPQYDLLILGATGVTGRQTTRYLASHPESKSFTLAIAARSQKKLDALVAEYSLPSSIQKFTLDVTNFEQVEALVKNAKVVLNTVGPYYRWGTPVVRACARNGVHYVDLTGEPYWVRDIINKYDYCASKTGAIIVPACGFDSIPSDISVFVANKALKEFSSSSSSTYSKPLQIESSTTSFSVNGTISFGSFSTLITALESVPRVTLLESRRDYYLSPVKGRPTASLKFLYTLFVPTTLQTHLGSIFVMRSANKPIVERSWGLFEYAADHVHESENRSQKDKEEAQVARYGPNMVYDEFMRTSGSLTARLMSLGLVVTMVLMSVRPFRWIAKKIGPQEGTGPSDAALEKGKFKAVNVTKTEGGDASPCAVVTFEGKGDPGYLLSPIMMADGALSLLSPSSLSPLARKGGILTPATAFGDAFVKRMHENPKFDLRVEVVPGGAKGGEGRKRV
ncbi:hypothetical protein K435DRAFT_960259 [Dendrothele bispora CBS 962.96]|uniref:Saccharopine dehydrogenase NADP binding domain-containing protein n=1 Tax=Dendrothele bispora (strain CBS 962.96) TaxID=1314807 RepID=A0A4S8MTW4_DENBC|nr:hypothetical protein K435DRAFT_960259 [Dendrothele bispora CBS 962.96]